MAAILKNMVMANFIQGMQVRQELWKAQGNPLTEDKLKDYLQRQVWSKMSFYYKMADVTFDDLVKAAREVLFETDENKVINAHGELPDGGEKQS